MITPEQEQYRQQIAAGLDMAQGSRIVAQRIAKRERAELAAELDRIADQMAGHERPLARAHHTRHMNPDGPGSGGCGS